MTKDDLDKLQRLIVVQHEGIIYCPIPKVKEHFIIRAKQVSNCYMQEEKTDRLSVRMFG